MSPGEYLLGFALLVLMLAPTVIAAVRLRGRLLPAWSGPPARLAEATLALTLLVCIGMALGSVGQFKRAPVTVACIVVGVAFAALARPRPLRAGEAPPPAPPTGPKGPRLMIALAACALIVVVAQWLPHVVTSYQRGMLDGDTMWYHAPFAARFVQSGWTTRLLFTNYKPLVTFFPANGELLAAMAILPFHYDILLPLINIGWLALAVLAGWCVGRPFGAGPVGVAAVAVVASLPVMAVTQAGTLRNDMIVVALFLTAVALILNARWQPAAMGVGGLAAGMAIGTKVDLIGPVVVLVLGTVAAAPGRPGRHSATSAGSRSATGRLSSAAPLVVTTVVIGSFWYVRNLARSGNPLPWYGLHLGPLWLHAAPVAASVGSSTVVSHAADAGFWTRAVGPGLLLSFGPLWPALLAVALAGMALAMATGGSFLVRALGVVAAASAVIYLFTPNTVPGAINRLGNLNFALNLRYLAPALIVGLVLLATLPPLGVAARRVWVELVLVAIVAANQYSPKWLHSPETSLTAGALWWGIAITAVAAAVVGLLAAQRWSPQLSAAAAAGITAACVGLGFPVQRSYLNHRYSTSDFPSTMASAYPWAQRVEDRRIAITGDFFQYPLYGKNLSNWVQTVGRNGPHGSFLPYTTCRGWWNALDAARYDYVAIAPPVFVISSPAELTWTESNPAAVRIHATGKAPVFALDASPQAVRCG